MTFTAGFSSLHNALNLVPGSRLNDSRVTILHIILRHFAFVLFLLLGKKIRGEFLLKPSITLVFFVCENALDDLCLPYLFPAGCRNVLRGEMTGYVAGGFSVTKHPVDEVYRFCFFRHDLRKTVRTLPVTEELTVWKADFPVRKLLPAAPCDIF